MRTVVLQLTDEQAEVLEQTAEQRGTSVDDLIAEWVGTLAERVRQHDVTQDPIFNIQSHENSAPADLSQNADRYLYGS